MNAAERRLIADAIGPRDAGTNKVPWKRILSSPQMWLLATMYFCYNYPLGIYLDWFPKYLNAARGFSVEKMGFYASLPLFAAVVGDLAGGWISDIWARHTNLRTARKRVAVIGFVIAGTGILTACLTPNALISVAWSCMAMFGLELTVGVAGRASRYRRRLCGIRLRCYELLRQYGRCGGDHAFGLSGEVLRLDIHVCCDVRAGVHRGPSFHPD